LHSIVLYGGWHGSCVPSLPLLSSLLLDIKLIVISFAVNS
jgi:hypothetical protein